MPMSEGLKGQHEPKHEPLQEAWRRGPDVSPEGTAKGAGESTCWQVTIHSPRQMERLAAHLGAIVERGAVIVLDGDLGAGKTTFVRGLARGIGLPDGIVSSPTFTLIHEYEGDVPLYHFDAYRLEGPEEFFALGAEEYLYGDGVCAIDWGVNVRSALPRERLEIVTRAGESGTGPASGGSPVGDKASSSGASGAD